MPICDICFKSYANRSSLSRHQNSQHTRKKHYKCFCGKTFLDQAACSRCKASHSRSFGCPACHHRTARKDSLVQHLRRLHPDQAWLEGQIVTLPPKSPTTVNSPSNFVVHVPPLSIPRVSYPAPFLHAPVPSYPQLSPAYSDVSTLSSSEFSDAWSLGGL